MTSHVEDESISKFRRQLWTSHVDDKSISNLIDKLQAFTSQQLWDNLDILECYKHVLIAQTDFIDPYSNQTAIDDIEKYRRVMINLCHTALRIKAI